MPSKRLVTSSVNKGREAGDWIQTYLDFTEFTEPPTTYHRWVALGCISAALQRRVYFDWGMERIFPNLYIVLLGPSAQTRKSTALRVGEELIKDLGIPIIGQENTKESVVRDLQKANTSFNDGSNIRMQSAAVCFASELAVFLGKQDTPFQADLTDWYDSPDQWKRSTKHQGVDDIAGLSFTLVGAMAPDWIPHVFAPESIGGGFTSRIVFVNEFKKAHTIANPSKYPPANGRRVKLLNDLQTIQTNLVGEFKFSKDAEEFYESWYTEDDRLLQQGDYAVPDRAFYSYCGRRPTLLRKISMCVSASRTNSQIIELEHIEDALDWMEQIEKNMPGTFAAVGRSPFASAMAALKSSLKQRGSFTRSSFLRSMAQDISSEELNNVEKTLEESKIIKLTRLTESNDTLYEWIEEK
jgi:hypothetical protein